MIYADIKFRKYLEGSDDPAAALEIAAIDDSLGLLHDDAPGLILPAGYRICMNGAALAAVDARRAEWEDAQMAMADGSAEWRRPPIRTSAGLMVRQIGQVTPPAD